MQEKVKGIILYPSMFAPIAGMSLEQKGILLEACFHFLIGEEYKISDPMVSMAFGFYMQQFNLDQQKYEERCRKNSDNVRKRWDNRIQSNTNVYDGIQSYNSNTNDTNTNTNENTSSSIIPPTPQGDGASKKKSRSLSNADIMAIPYAEDFEQVWKAYPKHAAKGQAWVTWYKLTAKMADKFPTVDALLLAIKWLKVSDQWEKDGGKYIPNMSSWLNNAGWEDDEAQVPAPDPRNRVWTPEEEARRKELEDEYNGIAKIYRDQGKWKEAYKVEHILEEILEQEGLGLWQ